MSHSYSGPGPYRATLTVVDELGARNTSTEMTIEVDNRPERIYLPLLRR